jgi:hypothetical protein
MQRHKILAGSTSRDIPVSIYDSSSAIGAKLAGLTYSTAGTWYYTRQGAAGAAGVMTLVTKTKGTWVSLGFVQADNTNMPGDYELGLPNAAIDVGAAWVLIQGKGATNAVPVEIFIELEIQPVNVTQLLGTAWLTPAVAGTPDVNVKTHTAGAIVNATFASDVGSTAYASNLIALAADKAGQNGVNVTKLDGSALSTHATGMVPADIRDVVGAAVSTATAQLGVNTVSVSANAINASAIADSAIDAGSIANSAITNAKFAAGAIDSSAIADGAIDILTFASDVGTTAVASNPIAKAVVLALIDENLDHLAKTATGAADMTSEVADNTILSRIIGNGDTSTFVPSTDGLQAERALTTNVHDDLATLSGGLATAAEISDTVWDETASDHTTTNTMGKKLNDAGGAADPWATAIPGSYGSGTAGERMGRIPNAAAGGAGGLPTVDSSNRVAGVSGNVAGSVASVTNDVGITQAGADKAWGSAARTLTAFSTTLALSVWDVLLTAIATTSSIGKKLKDWVLGADSKVLLSTDAQSGVTIPTVTNLTNAAGAGDFTATMKTSLNASTPASVGALGTQAKADVNVEVLDVIATDAQTEPGQGAPAASVSLGAKINYLFKWFRNKKTDDGSVVKFYNDDAATVDQKRTVGESAGTVTADEIGSGP